MQRLSQRDENARIKSEAAALLASRDNKCFHCGRQHPSERCWKKLPHLASRNKKNKDHNKALNSERKAERSGIGVYGDLSIQ